MLKKDFESQKFAIFVHNFGRYNDDVKKCLFPIDTYMGMMPNLLKKICDGIYC